MLVYRRRTDGAGLQILVSNLFCITTVFTLKNRLVINHFYFLHLQCTYCLNEKEKCYFLVSRVLHAIVICFFIFLFLCPYDLPGVEHKFSINFSSCLILNQRSHFIFFSLLLSLNALMTCLGILLGVLLVHCEIVLLRMHFYY